MVDVWDFLDIKGDTVYSLLVILKLWNPPDVFWIGFLLGIGRIVVGLSYHQTRFGVLVRGIGYIRLLFAHKGIIILDHGIKLLRNQRALCSDMILTITRVAVDLSFSGVFQPYPSGLSAVVFWKRWANHVFRFCCQLIATRVALSTIRHDDRRLQPFSLATLVSQLPINLW